MTFTRPSYAAKADDGKRFRLWYDHHERLWTFYEMDADGNQISDAEYLFGACGLKAAIASANLYRKKPLIFRKETVQNNC